MKEIFSNPEVIASITSCVIAFFSMLTALFVTIRQRQSVAKATAYADAKLAELEKENAKLKSQVLDQYFKSKENEKEN